MLSLMFLTLHFDPLAESSATLDDISKAHKFSYLLVKIGTEIFGIHFIRILYSGLFGLSISTLPKAVGNVNAFRFPLEKLCMMNFSLINLPRFIEYIGIVAFYSVETNSWQIAMFGMVLNCFLSGFFLKDYYRSPWRS